MQVKIGLCRLRATDVLKVSDKKVILQGDNVNF